MNNSRLFQILYLLMERGEMTAGELSKRLEVSQRTIYRDIDALSASGIPIYATKGRSGGIRLMEQFQMERSLFSEAQQDQMLTALSSLEKLGVLEDGQVLTQLSALFQKEPLEWLEVDFDSWGANEQEREHFSLCKTAVIQRRLLTFQYYNASGISGGRTIEPHRLRFRGGSWYVYGYCRSREDFRLFRLNRMTEVVMQEEHFIPRELLKEETPTPWPEEDFMSLKLKFSEEVAYRVMDTFYPEQIKRMADGSLYVETTFPKGDWILGFLLSFGGDVEVLSPSGARERLQKESLKIFEIYDTGCHIKRAILLEKQEEQQMKEKNFCQSCGMPMEQDGDFGTNQDGTKNQDYCHYCYEKGAFTDESITMDGMIEINLKFNEENGHPFGTREEAKKMMEGWFPTLKRWSGAR